MDVSEKGRTSKSSYYHCYQTSTIIHLKCEERLKDIKRAITKRQKLDMTSRRKFEKKIKAALNKMDEIGTLFPDLV